MKKTEGEQVAPRFGGFSGWTDITFCRTCGRVGYRYDCAPSSPCAGCCSKVLEGAGRWHPPVVPSKLWRIAYFLNLTDRKPESKPGFWEIK